MAPKDNNHLVLNVPAPLRRASPPSPSGFIICYIYLRKVSHSKTAFSIQQSISVMVHLRESMTG